MIFELTKDTIAGIIATGKNTNSALAEAYIAHVKSKCGYDVFACYASAFQELSTDGTHLINQFELDVYLKGFPLKNPITDHLKDMLFDCFIEVLDDNGVTFEYNRIVTPEEMKKYGWLNKKASEWDRSVLITPVGQPIETRVINVDSIERLDLWHCMYNSLSAINRLDAVESILAKVYCGWDEVQNSMNLYIILPESRLRSLSEAEKSELNGILFSKLCAVDKLDIINKLSPNPVYTKWSALSPVLKKAFLCGR